VVFPKTLASFNNLRWAISRLVFLRRRAELVCQFSGVLLLMAVTFLGEVRARMFAWKERCDLPKVQGQGFRDVSADRGAVS
jgi:hypothetical protein